MHSPRHPARSRTVVRLRGPRVIFVVLVAALTLSACDVRLETPPPTEPTPHAVEQVRARTVDDALLLEAGAQASLAVDGTPEALAAVLTDVAQFSAQHADQLGGVYDSGLPEPTPAVTPTGAAPPVSTPQALLDELVHARDTAVQDADAVDDGDLARLVGSVAVSRGELAERLAAASGLPAPVDATTEPVPDPTAGTDGPTAAVLDALALAHDQAGFGFEVLATRLSGDTRATARAGAAAHRGEGDRWAAAAGSAGTQSDPRRASYTLPTGLDDPAVVDRIAQALETAVADAAASVVASAPAGTRRPFVDGLRQASRAAATWGSTPVALPGLPERADSVR